MTAERPRRSVLYMPGSNPRAIEKARTLPCDAVILDLEDAVAPDRKDEARDAVVAAVSGGGFGHRETVVRINAPETPWVDADIEAVAASGADAILLPKVDTDEDVFRVGRTLNRLGAPESLSIWTMMETPAAVLNAGRIAAAVEDGEGRRLEAFVIGTNDLAKETRALLEKGRATFLPWLTTFVAAARAYDLAVIDGVFNDLADEDGFEEECEQGRALGMDGKTVIHPKQIRDANIAFSPSEDELAWARKILAAFERPENEGRGAIQVEGRLVERLHAEVARRTVALADQIFLRDQG